MGIEAVKGFCGVNFMFPFRSPQDAVQARRVLRHHHRLPHRHLCSIQHDDQEHAIGGTCRCPSPSRFSLSRIPVIAVLGSRICSCQSIRSDILTFSELQCHVCVHFAALSRWPLLARILLAKPQARATSVSCKFPRF